MTENCPLVVLSDERLLDEVLRLAAAAGCAVERPAEVGPPAARWAEAPLIIVDERAARSMSRVDQRTGVVLVCSDAPDPAIWQLAFSVGVGHVLSLPGQETSLLTMLADVAEGPGAPEGAVLAVVGGRGGGGASVFAAATGLAAARTGSGAVLVDCDPLGGGVDLLLGTEQDTGLRWPDLRVDGGRVSMSALESALPSRTGGRGRLAVVSCDREGPVPDADAVGAVVDAGRRAGHVVVCDLPRSLDGPTPAVLERADLIAIVLPAEVRATAAAARVRQRVDGRVAREGVVVRGPAPDDLAANHVASVVGAELLATMAPERGLPRALERGAFDPRNRGPLMQAAAGVLAALRPVAAETASS